MPLQPRYPTPTCNPRFERGTRVFLESVPDEDDVLMEDLVEDDGQLREYGIVIDNYWDPILGNWRCWVGFYGFEGFPDNPKNFKPYVLNYGEVFLHKCEDQT